MFLVSDEFEEALKKEVDRLVAERQNDFFETAGFYSRLNAEVKKELDSMSPFFSYASEGEKLRLFLGPPECDAERHIDIDEVIKKELEEGDDEHLKFILSGLERLADVIHERISPNA